MFIWNNTLQRGKLRHREMKYFGLSYTARKGRDWDLDPGRPTAEATGLYPALQFFRGRVCRSKMLAAAC